ncbi:MAG: VCBS repeat-containing protein [Flavobacteriaceae bacterium]|nr:VCBS repeat-containing protein [Flavobacteriaceae bacterium]
MFRNILLSISLILLLSGCNKDKKEDLFEYVDVSRSNITFSNTIIQNDSINPADCLNCFNGGGVGIGDFNNDGLPDIIFTGNQVSSKIYLNRGSLKFEDVSETSNFIPEGWITGVSIVDINSDGLDDIYLNVGGFHCDGECKNLLYVNNGLNNNGIPTFTESAEEYGLDDGLFSQQSVFFDYDNDGDLDVYIVHNSNRAFFNRNMAVMKDFWPKYLADFLLRNDSVAGINHPVFTNVSKELNITRKGLGLGIGIADFNNDNLIDLYVSNDFITEDHLYINKAHKDSTKPKFIESNKQYVQHQTINGMGMDIADINNDGLPDVMVLDMIPKDYKSQKRMMSSMKYNGYLNTLNNGYTSQYMHNTLQFSNGMLDGNPIKSSEVAFLLGISNTGWSWGPLMVDFDNDGDKDIYICNGFIKDLIDLDFINFSTGKSKYFTPSDEKLKEFLGNLPSIVLPNSIYEQKDEYTFDDVSVKWIEDQPSLSNGVAYADFDLDGDLDIAINNINSEAFLIENKTTEKLNNHYLRLQLKGQAKNSKAIGAKITIWSNGKEQHQFQSVIRGYMSSMEPIIHFGVKTNTIDSLRIIWPGGKISKLKNIKADQVLEIDYASAGNPTEKKLDEKKLFSLNEEVLNFSHQENFYNEYLRQPLLIRQYSQKGPCIASANIDGFPGDEIFIGGSFQKPGQIWAQNDKGVYYPKQALDSIYEDTGAVFFDVDNDSDLDLYVSSGGNEFNENSPYYKDRLYLNDGKGSFSKVENILPESFQSTGCIRPIDIDHDNDMDLFIGARITPGNYPKTPESSILINENGHFIKRSVSEISKIGMVTDAVWIDIDGDNWEDLIIVGEFMEIKIFKNNRGELSKMSTTWVDENNQNITTEGWWNCIKAADFDNDGDIDFIVGNQGLNGFIKPKKDFPLYIYAKDFDKNGIIDPVLGQYFEDEEGENILFPIHTRDGLKTQFPDSPINFFSYEEFTHIDFKKLLGIKDLESETLKATIFSSSYIENLGNGKFKLVTLPKSCQVSPINDILIDDFNHDGFLDALLVGNDFTAESNYGRFDALTGLFLEGTKSGFKVIPSRESGFYVPYQSNHITEIIDNKGRKLVLSTQNNKKIRVFNVEKK